jgi:RecA-family ATPase
MSISEKIKFLKSLRQGNIKSLLDSNLPEVDWYVEDIVPEGMIMALFGPAGQYKSTLSLYLALCIATGKDTFLYRTKKKGKVLWIDEEMGIIGLKHKVEQLAKGLNIKSDDLNESFFYTSMMGLKLDTPEGVETLNQYILLKEINIIFVDSMSKVINGDENKTQDMSKFLHNLRMISDEFGIAFVFMHHTRKEIGRKDINSMRGSTEFANQVDYLFSLEKVGQNKVKLAQEKNRYNETIKGINFDVEVNDESMTLTYVGLAKDESLKSRNLKFAKDKGIVSEYITKYPKDLYSLTELQDETKLTMDVIRNVIYRDKDSLQALNIVKYIGSNKFQYLLPKNESKNVGKEDDDTFKL